MFRHKRLAIMSIGALMLFCFSVGVAASGPIEKVSVYLRHDFTVKLNGKKVQLGHPLMMYQGWSYIPLSDVAKLLNIDVRFDPGTKTMYINGHVNRVDTNTQYDVTSGEFEMTGLTAYQVTYLGRDYPVLADRDYQKNIIYLRLKDMQRMGLDTGGLTVVREKYTKQLYVRKSDLASLWQETPKFGYNPGGVLVTGETDSNKIEALEKLPREISAVNAGDYLQLLVIDAADKPNEYDLLGYLNGSLMSYHVELKQYSFTYQTDKNKDQWFINGYNSTLLKAAPNPYSRYTY